MNQEIKLALGVIAVMVLSVVTMSWSDKYFSPYERCVRATMEDTKFPTDEVGARLTCARALSKY